MRALLLVPGDGPERFDGGLASVADTLVVDLSACATVEARQVAAGFLRRAPGRPRLHVRVSALASGRMDADLDAVMAAQPDAIWLPQAGSGMEVAQLANRLAVREAECGIPDGATRIIAFCDTPRSVLGLATLPGASRRLAGIAWSADGLAAALGARNPRRQDGSYADPARHARCQVLLAASAAGIPAIDTAYPDADDLAGLARECRAAAADGFGAKLAINPAQVPVIEDAFLGALRPGA